MDCRFRNIIIILFLWNSGHKHIFAHCGVGQLFKFCPYTFFPKNESRETREVFLAIQLAMILTAFLCVLIGVYPQSHYWLLPFSQVNYQAYSPIHVLGVVRLFLLGGLVFILAQKHFAPHRGIALDFDCFYRLGGGLLLWFCTDVLNAARLRWQERVGRVVKAAVQFSRD